MPRDGAPTSEGFAWLCDDEDRLLDQMVCYHNGRYVGWIQRRRMGSHGDLWEANWLTEDGWSHALKGYLPVFSDPEGAAMAVMDNCIKPPTHERQD